eukprot:UN07908
MASNKPDIDFDYLSYAQMRIDGYFYMKNSCLLAVLPLIWSKLQQSNWILKNFDFIQKQVNNQQCSSND